MASRFTPVSPGSAIFASIGQMLRDQENQRRQSTLDGIEVQSRLAAIQRAEQEARRQAREDELKEADRLASINGPSADLSPETATLLKQAGYRVDEWNTLPARTREVAAAPGVIVPAEQLASKAYSRRGETHTEQLAREQRESAQSERDEARKFRDEQADAERAFRGEQGEATRNAARERADADREMKMLLADMARSGSAETRALANELKRLQIASAADKLETTQATREKDATNARQTTSDALRLVDRLLDPNDVGAGLGAATGAYEMRGFTQGAQDFNGVRDQLVAALTQPHLGALKGPMSDKDVTFVKSLATRLDNRRLSGPETQKALAEAQAFLRTRMGGASNSGGNTRRVGRFEVVSD